MFVSLHYDSLSPPEDILTLGLRSFVETTSMLMYEKACNSMSELNFAVCGVSFLMLLDFFFQTALLLLKILQHSGWFGQHKVTISESVEKQDTNECEKCDGTDPTSMQKCVDVSESNETKTVNKDFETRSCTCYENSNNNVTAMSNLSVHCESKDSNLETETNISFEQHFTDSRCLENMLHSQAQTNGSDINDIGMYIGGLLLRHIQQLVCNAHAITEVQVTPAGADTLVEETSQVRVATAIYPTASLMNHSCDPTIISRY